MKRIHMKRLEVALLTGLLLAIVAISPQKEVNGIQEKITRLHILANSDSNSDQALKLFVRDSLIENAHILDGDYATKNITPETLKSVETIAQQAVYEKGYTYPVKAETVKMYFDTRVYDGFALPAGRYDAVRVLIGEGKGKNWWCVLFPPLCTPLAQGNVEQVAKDAGLTGEEIGLITQDGQVYALKFKVAEWFGELFQ